MSEIEEGAKAVGQLARLGQTLLNKIRDVERIGGQILGPFGQGYGILTDIVRHKREEINWRLKNRLKIYQLVAQEVERQKLRPSDLKTIPKRIAYDYEEGVETEDEPSIQQLWANLLVNAANPRAEIEPLKIYADVLGRIDTDGALLLNELGLRSEAVDFYFIVCKADFGRVKGGAELAAVSRGDRADRLVKIPKTKLFRHYNAELSSFFISWSPEKIDATVDSLQSLGLVHRVKELHMAEELLATDEGIRPSKTLLQIGQRVLQNADGVDGFKLSQLGLDFITAITAPTNAYPPSKGRSRARRRK